MTPGNLFDVATYVDSDVSIQNDGKTIHFAAGQPSSLLMTFAVGPVIQNTAVKVTIGLRSKSVDSDPLIGITGAGKAINRFYLADTTNYPSNPPCGVHSSEGSDLGTRVPTDTPGYSQVTIVFDPSTQYGTCSTAQVGGYVNVAIFNDLVSPLKGLYFVQVYRDDDADEVYDFYYFIIEASENDLV